MLDRTLAPEIHEISKVEFQYVREEILPNGVLFASLESGDQEVVKLEVIFPNAGNKSEIHKGQASMAVSMLKEGTASFSSAEITHNFSNLGAYIEVNPGFDNASVAMYCLDKHVKPLLPLFSEILHAPSFEGKELELQKELQMAQLLVQNKKNSVLASKGIRQAIFGSGHPYGRIISENDIRDLQAAHLNGFWKKSKNNFEVLLSGAPSKFTIDAIRNLFGSKMNFEFKESGWR
ncbi:MAG: insulinase family protein, partial [Bacteroidota bacterium]